MRNCSSKKHGIVISAFPIVGIHVYKLLILQFKFDWSYFSYYHIFFIIIELTRLFNSLSIVPCDMKSWKAHYVIESH